MSRQYFGQAAKRSLNPGIFKLCENFMEDIISRKNFYKQLSNQEITGKGFDVKRLTTSFTYKFPSKKDRNFFVPAFFDVFQQISSVYQRVEMTSSTVFPEPLIAS